MAIARAKRSGDSSRKGWAVLFRHPLEKDAQGNPKRTRRGLNTRDPGEADQLVEQVNGLLARPELWTFAAKERATRELGLHPKVAEIFYEQAAPPIHDPWKVRDTMLPLPSAEEGYARVQIIGQFGAGKTTLLRQLIGSDPERDRFPSTSNARATIFDTEVILTDGLFRAVASFMPRDRVLFYIQECVVAAVSAAAEGLEDTLILRRLLQHSEQRFRLDYLLGNLRLDDGEHDEDESDEDVEDSTVLPLQVTADEERSRFQQILHGFLGRVKPLAISLRDKVSRELEVDPTNLGPSDRDALQDLLEHELEENEDTAELTNDILEEVETRFSVLKEGEYCRDASEWPMSWTFVSDDRDHFLNMVRRLSSNQAPDWGRLLTPLVDGLRVAGPFQPRWSDTPEIPKLVFMDGEGLGHTPASSFSLPSSLTSRYALADAILLVDSAQQPMPTSAQLVMRSLATTGHDSKLAIAFTHFDQVRGDALPDIRAREAHLFASLDNAIAGLEPLFGHTLVRSMQRQLKGRVFFLSNIKARLPDKPTYTRRQLRALLEMLQDTIAPTPAVEGAPVYDQANLGLGVRDALVEFHRYWNAVLGRMPMTGVQPEHWTRVKALTRRFALRWNDHYDTLQPVADLVRLLEEKLYRFVAEPRTWKPSPPPEDERQSVLARVRQEIHSMAQELVKDRLFVERTAEWIDAFECRGAGSTYRRAGAVRNIYELAAPVPQEAAAREASEFLDLIRERVRDAVVKAGGEII
jgi:hypothetical protein